MKIIFKFELAITDVQGVSMPRGARLLCVQNQRERIMLWVEIARDEGLQPFPDELRTFWIVGTGRPMPNVSLVYVGTVQTTDSYDNHYVWHVYEQQR